MRSKDDAFTMELPMPGAKRAPGRPKKPDALTGAQRAKRYRERHRGESKDPAAQVWPAISVIGSLRGDLQVATKRIEDLERQLSEAVAERDKWRRFAGLFRLKDPDK